jgi:hypothetical protein
MTFDEIMKTLVQVQCMCKGMQHCSNECPFYLRKHPWLLTNCGLNVCPENWLLDQINEKKGESNDK